MHDAHRARWWRTGLLLIFLGCASVTSWAAPPQTLEIATAEQEGKRGDDLPRPKRVPLKEDPERAREIEASLPQLPPSILPKEANAVDLACVLRLAGVENPEILIARQRVFEGQAEQMAAYAMSLPNLNAGLNYDAHTGPLQQSSGNILKVNRNALYLGLGANAVAGGTVGIPGIQYVLNVSEGFFNALAIRQTVRIRQFESVAVRNDVFLRVCLAYMNLLRAEGTRVIAMKNRDEAHEIARLTAVYARTGAGKQSDADRAAAELARRNDAVVQAEGDMLVRSAQLAQLINVPPSIQLHAIDGWVIPTPIVPDPIPLAELLVIAMNQRPELAARRAAIRQAIVLLRSQQLLPFSPTIIAGYSAGTFGGGSNLVSTPGGFQGFFQPRFDSFGARDDIDVIMFWTAQNVGVGNLARIRARRVETQIAELELVRELNRVRNDVATAYAGTHARYAQIGIAQRGVEFGRKSYIEDLGRIRGGEGLPIELLDSFRLLAEARLAYLDSIVAYDKAQFALYVALGQPPAKYLAHEVPSDLVPPPQPAPPLPGCAPPGGKGDACAACRATP
jgi:outer membrane protein TolC